MEDEGKSRGDEPTMGADDFGYAWLPTAIEMVALFHELDSILEGVGKYFDELDCGAGTNIWVLSDCDGLVVPENVWDAVFATEKYSAKVTLCGTECDVLERLYILYRNQWFGRFDEPLARTVARFLALADVAGVENGLDAESFIDSIIEDTPCETTFLTDGWGDLVDVKED